MRYEDSLTSGSQAAAESRSPPAPGLNETIEGPLCTSMGTTVSDIRLPSDCDANLAPKEQILPTQDSVCRRLKEVECQDSRSAHSGVLSIARSEVRRFLSLVLRLADRDSRVDAKVRPLLDNMEWLIDDLTQKTAVMVEVMLKLQQPEETPVKLPELEQLAFNVAKKIFVAMVEPSIVAGQGVVEKSPRAVVMA